MTSKASSARQRVIVAVGSDAPDPLALSAAAQLARSAGAELAALFVEDINLLRLAELPFAFEIGPSSATARRLEVSEVERAFRHRAEELRNALAETASELEVSLTFETARGRPARVLLEAAAENDLVVLAASSLRVSAGLPAATVVCDALRSVMPSKSARMGPVAAVLRSAVMVPRVLSTAYGLAQRSGTDLVVFLAEQDEEPGNAISIANTWLAEHDAAADMRPLPDVAPVRIASLIADQGPAALFWAGTDEPGIAAEIETLLATVGCPLIVVR